MGSLVDSMVQTVQHISAQLRPAILDDLGLEAAIESHVEDFASWNRCGYRVELALSHLKARRDRDTAVFRIVQEALTNVARHSRANMVVVRGAVDAGTLRVDIEDNGQGIPEHRLTSADALGLLGMRERAEAVGGSVLIRRRNPRGTIVTINVPVEGNARLEDRTAVTVA
jgi:signal transduction histidine kinase